MGSVAIAGQVQAKDTLTITINGTAYTYTVVAADTLQTIVDNMVKQINKAPDPNVIATPNDSGLQVVLTARTPGADGGNITLTTGVSSTALITGTASGATLNIYLENPSQIAPGTVIEVSGQKLCDDSASGDFAQPYLPDKPQRMHTLCGWRGSPPAVCFTWPNHRADDVRIGGSHQREYLRA